MLPDKASIKQWLSSHPLFKKLDEPELDYIASQASPVLFHDGQIIYDRDDRCNGFFIIHTGRITVMKTNDDEQSPLAILGQNDFFGEEVFNKGSARRQNMAMADGETILIKFSRTALEDIVRKIPSLRQVFNLLLQSFELRLQKNYSWVNEDEHIRYIARKHIYLLFNALILPVLLGLIVLIPIGYLYINVIPGNPLVLALGILISVLGLFWAAWKGWDWTNDYFIVTNHRIINLEKVALFYESRQETPLEAIQSIEMRSDQLGRWIGYGDVVLKTYTGMIELPNLESPEWVVSMIQEEWSRLKSNLINASKQDVENDIRQRLNPDSTRAARAAPVLPVNPTPSVIESGELTSFLSGLFKLREEVGDTLIYRTHWWILVRKTWMPALLLITLVAYLLTGASGALGSWDILSSLSIALVAGLFLWIWFLYQYVDWRNDIYMITPDQIIDINRKPLGKEEKRTAPLKNIQTIEYKRLGLIGLMLNFGTVFIRIGDTEFTFDYVDDPSEVQKELFERFMRFNKREKEMDIQAERGRIADYLDAYHRLVKENGSVSPDQKHDDIG